MCPHDSLGATVATQFIQVVQGRFGAWQDDDVGLLDILCIVGIEQMDAWVTLQRVKVGVIRQVTQHDNGHIDLATLGLHRLLSQRHTVLLLDIDILVVWDDTQHGNSADVLQHFAAFVKQAHIAAKLVDDNALDKLSVLESLQGDTAINRSEYPTPVNVAHQDDIGMGMTGHGQVHQVGVPQVDLRNAASSLHHDGIVTCCQALKGIAHLTAVIDVRRASSPVIIGILVADGLAVQDDLRSVVALGLQQQRVHIGVARDSSGLGLNGLGAPDFKAFGRRIGVQRHVLGLERCRAVTVLLEDAAQGCRDNALAHVATCPSQHHRVQSFDTHSFSLAKTNR